MSIKARIMYVIFFIALNAIGNTIGSAFIAFIALALPWLVIIPALSRVTKFDLLHNKIAEKFGGDNIDNIKEDPKQANKNEASEHTNINQDASKEKNVEDKSSSKNIDEEKVKTDSPLQTVKQLILEAVDATLKDFLATPPKKHIHLVMDILNGILKCLIRMRINYLGARLNVASVFLRMS